MIEMFEECTACKGTGKVMFVEAGHFGPANKQVAHCNKCKGTGYTSEKVRMRDLTYYIGMQVTTRGGG